VATLVRAFGDIDVAEDAVQKAFAVALGRWPRSGLPANYVNGVDILRCDAPATSSRTG
jgi:predicted RNA polymerase sigma factor